MTREELIDRYQYRIEILRHELWHQPDGRGFGLAAMLRQIIRERNEMLMAFGFKVPQSGRYGGFVDGAAPFENRYSIRN